MAKIHSANWNHARLDFSRPVKPVDSCVCDEFNGSLGRVCLWRHWFGDLAESQQIRNACQEDYNNHQPRSSLQTQSSTEVNKAGALYARSLRARS